MPRCLIAARWPLLLCGLLLAALAWYPSQGLDFDRSVENMFAADDPLIQPYRRLKQVFGGNELVLAVYTDKELLAADRGGVDRLAKISHQLEQVDGVGEVLSLSQLDEALSKLSGLGEPSSIVDADSKLSRKFREIFAGYTHGEDGETASVVCMLQPENETAVPREKTIEAIRAIVDALPDGKVTGEPVMIVDGFRYVEQDGRRLGWMSTWLLAATIIFCFRSLRWVLIPLVVVRASLLFTEAILVWSGQQLSMVSSMLTAIVTVVGVATVVHVIVRFREGRLMDLTPRDALARAIALLAVPVFWACVTDAAGFASLLVASVGPVQDFGVMTAIGALMVLLSVILFVPGLTLAGRFDSTPRRMWGEDALDTQLNWSIQWVQRRPYLVGGLAVIVVAFAILGTSRLEIESDFTKNFRADSRIVKAYDMVENRLGGAGVWDVILPAPKRLDLKYMGRVAKLQHRLRTEVVTAKADGSTEPALHVLSMLDAANVGLEGLGPMVRLLPKSAKFTVVTAGMKAEMPQFMGALHGSQGDQSYYRIMLRAVERQPAERKKQLIADVERICREEFPESQPTGFFVLLTYLIDSILRDQWLAFGVALAAIGVGMTVAFRGPTYALLALIPNAMPIFAVTGMMGWLGMKINMGAAMIAAVSLGLSVDSSIHYIVAYRRARREGKSLSDALSDVQGTVGRAAVFSTCALIVGFSSLCTSQFIPTVYFGALVSLSMLGGLLGNLMVLPLYLIAQNQIAERFTGRGKTTTAPPAPNPK